MDFVRSNDPKFKRVPGIDQELDYIPSQTLTYTVDSAAVLNSPALKDADIPIFNRQMTIDLKGKDYLGKHELVILDMLQTNNWQRPMYYAITVSPEQLVKLDPYFQQTGLAYQIVPMKTSGTTKSLNTEKMYDNLMNKFRWGGVDKPGVYLDENVLRMCKTYRTVLFGKLAAALINEGKKDKALKVLDKCMEVLPPENVPVDYYALSIAEFYYTLEQNEKAEHLYGLIADDAMRNLNWFFRLTPTQFLSVSSEVYENLAVLQEIMRVSDKHNPEFFKKYREEVDNYRMACQSLMPEEQ